MKRSELQRMDYRTLLDLARSLNVKVVEARGLDTRRGVRFHHDGMEWIALDSDLPVNEKIRTLGFLLESDRREMAVRMGFGSRMTGASSLSPVLTLCCS